MNPFKGSRTNKKCKRKFYIRQYSIFKKYNKFPIQILMNIIYFMIIKKKNTTQIRRELKNKYNKANIKLRVIMKFMTEIRKCISEYLKIYI